MKRILILISFLLLLLPVIVNATGGGLRKSSIKTCPDGVTYGMHSDGNGGTHWHVAITNGTNYYASGEAIYNDPCPGYKKNEGTAGSTNGSSNSSPNSSQDNRTTENYNNYNTDNYSNYNTDSYNNYNKIIDDQTNKANTREVIVEKSKDTSIKKLIIDGEEITASDNMIFKTEKKHVEIKIEANDSKSKVEYNNKELTNGENIINIYVTAENGDKKNYILTINKIKGKGTATIKKFILGSGKVKFENNKATIMKLKNETSLEYSYELSNNKAKLIMYLNEKETKELKSLKDNDIIKLVVIDKNDNENIYEIVINDYSAIDSNIIYVLSIITATIIMISPIVGIIIAIIIKKKRKKATASEKNN